MRETNKENDTGIIIEDNRSPMGLICETFEDFLVLTPSKDVLSTLQVRRYFPHFSKISAKRISLYRVDVVEITVFSGCIGCLLLFFWCFSGILDILFRLVSSS